jgi:hypothetical protein
MEPTKIIQKIKTIGNDNFALAEKYYSILSVINNLKLTQRELQLVSFIAVRGNISYGNIRKEFCERYNSTGPTINNIISKLKKSKVIIKEGSKTRINPLIMLDFNKEILLQISLIHG